MPQLAGSPVRINSDPTQVALEFLGAAPSAAGAAGFVAERVGHQHALSRVIRRTAGFGLYSDISPANPNCNANMVTAVSAVAQLPVWTWEAWIWDNISGSINVDYGAGFFNQGSAVSTPNPNGLAFGLRNQGGGGGLLVWDTGDGNYIDLTSLFGSGAWHHLAVVYDGHAFHAYVGGVLAGSHTAAGALPAGVLCGFGASAGNSSGGHIRFAEARLSNVPRYSAPFTPATAPFVADSATLGLWHFSDLPLGNWGVFYEVGGSSPAPGGVALPAGWHWTPGAALDSSGNGNDLGVALNVSTDIAIHGSVIYSSAVAGITAQDAVLQSPAVTSLQAMTGDVSLVDSTGAALAPTPGTPGTIALPSIPALDASAGNIAPVAGSAVAGAVGKAADAGHQHVGVHSVSAGTGVTLTGTASDPVINSSGGGGGGGGLNNEDVAGTLANGTSPGDAGSRADHFSGSSLNSKWTQVSAPTHAATVANSTFSARSSASAVWTQPYTPSGAFRVEARMMILNVGGTSPGIGFGVTDSGGVSSSNAILAELTLPAQARFTGWKGSTPQLVANNGVVTGQWVYAAVARDGSNNLTVQFSFDRNTWYTVATFAGFTATIALLYMQMATETSDGIYSFDFVDVTA